MEVVRTLLRSLPAAVLAAACGPGAATEAAEPGGDEPAAETVAAEDLAFVLTVPNPARSLERFAGLYGRLLERLAQAGVDLPAPPAQALREAGRSLLREIVFRRLLQLPGEVAVDLEAPLAVGAIVRRGADPALAAGVGVIPAGAGERPPRSGNPDVTLEPAGEGRLALGYRGGPAIDLAALPVAEAGAADDLVFRAWGTPAAERLRRALFGWAGLRRERGEWTELDELSATAASIGLDLFSGVRELRVGLRIGEGAEPAASLRVEVTAEPGSALAAALPPEDAPAGEFPFVDDVGPAPAELFAARPGPGTAAARNGLAEVVERLFAMFERTALPELTVHVAALGRAAGDLIRLLDGRYLDVSWPDDAGEGPAADAGPFLGLALGLLPRRTVILGVASDEAAREAVRRACAALEELGPYLMDFFGGPLDIGCQHEAERLGEIPVDVVVVRDRLEPWEVEAGIRPFSVDVHFAASGGRLAAATGSDWRTRLAAALGSAAPAGGRLADDAAWRELRDAAPDWATMLNRQDMAPLLFPELARSCPEAPGPAAALPVVLRGGVHEGVGRWEAETAASIVDDLARALAAGAHCGVLR